MANIYPAGSLVTVATYAGLVSQPTGGFMRDGVLADPLLVILRYQPGDGAAPVSITYPDLRIIRDATGLYRAELDTTGTQGAWPYQWYGVGDIQAIRQNAFIVTSAFPYPFP